MCDKSSSQTVKTVNLGYLSTLVVSAAESLDRDICRIEMRALGFQKVGNDLITELSRRATRRLFGDYNVLDPQSRPMH